MKQYQSTKYACYYTYLAMSSVFSLPPILFMHFNQEYGISYTLLGTLVLVNFCTQLAVDLLFSFFGQHFNPHTTLRVTPFLTGVGLVIYAVIPMLFPQYAYGGLLIGTFVFSLAAGLGEVLVSPTVAALPSDRPDKDMATLHSLYGYGVVLVVALSTVFFLLFDIKNWMYLALFWAVLPIIAGIWLCFSRMPAMNLGHGPQEQKTHKGYMGIILCMLCIFFGSCAENSMTNWISTYIEGTLGISKTVGDILGLTLFAVLLALTRTWYAKFGKNIYRVLLVSMATAIVCYLVASLSPIPFVSMIACVLTGIFTSMLWPGTLIYMEEKIPYVGVAAYALMAAGGDLGASVAPQLLGIITDRVNMQTGMLVAALFPLLGVVVLLFMKRYFKKHS